MDWTQVECLTIDSSNISSNGAFSMTRKTFFSLLSYTYEPQLCGFHRVPKASILSGITIHTHTALLFAFSVCVLLVCFVNGTEKFEWHRLQARRHDDLYMVFSSSSCMDSVIISVSMRLINLGNNKK